MEPLREEAIHNERCLRIVCIGAGASGLCLAYKLQRSFRNYELTIFEKNAGLSGTWTENNYPGCACDVPAHNYTYSFEPKSDWASVYASSDQINDYFNDFADKYSLRKYVKTQHQILEARWLEQSGQWNVNGKDLTTGAEFKHTCDVLINAGGFLNNWRWPQVPGLDSFKGTTLHSAHWDKSVQLEGRKVGLLGNGASAIQILPAIQPVVKSITNFIRSPTWISSLIGQEQHCYTDEELANFATKPDHLTAVRKMNEMVVNSVFITLLRDTQAQKETKTRLTEEMKQHIKDDSLHKKLIPNYAVGCRRLTPSVQYLTSLQRENVTIVPSGVTEFTPIGCKSGDREFEFDIIICATGFDTSYRPRFPIRGRDGINLQDAWAKDPEVYMGLAAAGFPNMFMFLGPHSPIGNGPVIPAIEASADYMLQLLDRYQTENISSFAPKAEAVQDFMAHARAFMRHTVWAEDCRSGYKSHSYDRTPSMWPGSTLHYVEALRELRADDWDIRYRGNRFAWLGNGFSQTEFDPTSDLAWYICDRDEAPFGSRGKRREVLTKSGSQEPRVLHTVQYSRVV